MAPCSSERVGLGISAQPASRGIPCGWFKESREASRRSAAQGLSRKINELRAPRGALKILLCSGGSDGPAFRSTYLGNLH
jgi:hypothetical protein